MHVLPYVSRNSSTSLIKRQNYSNLGRFNIATDDISSVLRKFLFYLLPDFTPSREHPFVLFLTAQIFDNSSRHLTKKHPRRGYRAKCLVSSESIRRIRNGARYRVKKTLSHTEELWARESFPFRDGETGGHAGREETERAARSSRHTLFMSSRVPLTMWVYEIKMHCLCKCRSRTRSICRGEFTVCFGE